DLPVKKSVFPGKLIDDIPGLVAEAPKPARQRCQVQLIRRPEPYGAPGVERAPKLLHGWVAEHAFTVELPPRFDLVHRERVHLLEHTERLVVHRLGGLPSKQRLEPKLSGARQPGAERARHLFATEPVD